MDNNDMAKKETKWRAAMQDEMESMKKNQVWDLVYLQAQVRILKSVVWLLPHPPPLYFL